MQIILLTILEFAHSFEPAAKRTYPFPLRHILRPAAALLAALAVATCSDSPSGPLRANTSGSPSAGTARGRVGFAPVFSAAASSAYARLSSFGVSYDNVHIVIVRPPSDTVKDTVVVFTPASTELTIDLDVPVRIDNEAFTGVIDYRAGLALVFHGEARVQAHPAGQSPPASQPVTVNYVGPGSNVAHLEVLPTSVSTVSPAPLSFTIRATDQSGAAVASVPVLWSSSDPGIATMTGDGTLQPTGRRGSVTVAATTLTNVHGEATANVTLPAASLMLVSGGSQTGKAGATLAAQAVVRVVASDGVGVPGIPVLFAAPSGASVSSTSVITDDAGNASASLKLGAAAGSQAFAASSGPFSVTIPETASPADPAAVVVVSGSAQSDTIRHTLRVPLAVRVSDAFGNPVPGAVVVWTRTAGVGALGAPTSITIADGTASVGYTLGTAAGAESVTASTAGVTVPAVFAFTAIAGAPATVTPVAGDAQTGVVGSALPTTLSVKVADDAGNAVAGATVHWSATNGTVATNTTTTDATGITAQTLTLGQAVGAAGATASIASPAAASTGGTVQFVATARAGAATTLVVRTGPPAAGASGVVLSTQPVIAVQDKFGNAATGIAVDVTATSSAGTATGNVAAINPTTGVATFSNLAVTVPATAVVTMSFSAPGLAAVTSSPIAMSGVPVPPRLVLVPASPTSYTFTAGAGGAGAPSIKVAEADGTPVPNAAVRIVVSRAGAGGQIISQGTLTTDAVGLASLVASVPGTAGSYTISATSAIAPGAEVVLAVSVVDVVVGVGSLTVSSQTVPPIAAGGTLAVPPIVTYRDAAGNPVAGATVTLTIKQGALTVGATRSATTNTAGQVSLGVLGASDLPRVPGSYEIVASLGELVAPSVLLTIIPGAPATLSATGPTSFTATAGSAPASAPGVLVTDAFGNGVADVGVVVITRSVAGSAVIGTETVHTDRMGKAGLGTIVIPTAGAFVLTATSGTLTGSPLTFNATIVAGGGAKLVLLTQPAATGIGGTPLSRQPVVQLQDQFGNPVTNDTLKVTATPSVGTATGSVVALTASTATFSALSLSASGTVTLTFTAGTATAPVTSAPIVLAGTARRFAITGADGSPIGAQVAGTAFSVKITARDVNDSVATGYTGTPVLASVSGLSTGSGATPAFVAGVLSSRAVVVSGTGDVTVTVADGAVSGTSNTFTVVPGATAQMALATAAAGASSGAAFATQPRVVLRDALGNAASNDNSTIVTMTVSSGATVVGTDAVTATAGVAAFAGVGVSGTTGTSYTLTFSSTGLTPVTQSITPTTGAASRLAISTQPGGGTTTVAFATQPVVQIRDAGGNLASTTSNAVTASIAGSAGTLTGTTSVNAVHGIVTFTNLAVTGTDTFRLVFTSPGLTSVTSSLFTVGTGTGISVMVTSPVPTKRYLFVIDSGSLGTSQGHDVAAPSPNSRSLTTTFQLAAGTNYRVRVLVTDSTGATVSASNPQVAAGGRARGITVVANTLTSVNIAATSVGVVVTSAPTTGTVGTNASFTWVVHDPSLLMRNSSNCSGLWYSAAALTADLYALGTGVTATTCSTVSQNVGDSVYTFTDVMPSPAAASTIYYQFTNRWYVPPGTAPTLWTPSVARGETGRSIVFSGRGSLALTTNAASAVVGAAFTTQPVVTLRDGTGSTITSDNSTVVTMTASTGATVIGTASVTAVNGVATFTNVGVTATAGTAYTLTFSATGLTAATQTITPAVGTVASIVLSPSSLSLTPLQTQQFTAVAKDAGGNVVSGASITWASSSASIATISSAGLATAVAVGSTTISATSNEHSATQTLTVSALSFTGLAAGNDHTCGLTAFGAAYCWGSNTAGGVGDGSGTNRLTAVPVAGSHVYTAIASGYDDSCGRTSAGVAYCWGSNSYGQLGDGTQTNRLSPVTVSSAPVFASVSIGSSSFHTCGLTALGAGYCWGYNLYGELGNASNTNSSSPVAVTGEIAFAKLTVGFGHTCGLTSAGAAYCWGDNVNGQLGDHTTTNRSSPVLVEGELVFASLTAGEYHTCGLTTAGAAYCWGYNAYGNLGNGGVTESHVPVAVAGTYAFLSLSAGAHHTCGLVAGGVAYCWGYNYDGELGEGSAINSASPTAVSGGLTFTALSAGVTHTCGLASAGGAYCWGKNALGAVGDGTTTDRRTPVAVTVP
jgi:alpha-tubulin suppressor-like RCC1 family protein